MQVADKFAFNNAFAQAAKKPIEVPAPELGADVVVRFKPTLTVDDVMFITTIPKWNEEESVLNISLTMLMMIDEDGNPVVDPKKDDWFRIGADGVLMVRLAKRAGLADIFARLWKRSVDEEGDGEPLTGESFERSMYDLSYAMRLAPDGMRSWPVKDMLELLKASARLSESREQDDAEEGE